MIENTTKLQYCEKCGQKLVWAKDRPQGYNRETGEKLPDKSIYQCPDWDYRVLIGYHDRIEVYPKGSKNQWTG